MEIYSVDLWTEAQRVNRFCLRVMMSETQRGRPQIGSDTESQPIKMKFGTIYRNHDLRVHAKFRNSATYRSEQSDIKQLIFLTITFEQFVRKS